VLPSSGIYVQKVGLYGVISQKITFITTAARTSNPTESEVRREIRKNLGMLVVNMRVSSGNDTKGGNYEDTVVDDRNGALGDTSDS
jgi:hypothetical protein